MPHSFVGLKTSLIAAVAALALAQAAHGQVDQRLLQRGFESTAHWADTSDEPTYIFGGQATDSESGQRNDIDIFYWDSVGRIKFDRNEPDPNLWLGYRALTISIEGDFAQITGTLNDVALAAAIPLNNRGQGDQWRVDFAGGIGSANDGHWSNTDSLYGIGTLNASKELDRDTVLNIGISYQGNRVFMPDIPLPYVTFQQVLSSSFSYEIGVLNGGLKWNVLDSLTLEVGYVTLSSLSTTLTFDVSNDCNLFFEYKDSTDGFFLNDQNNDRVFYDRMQVSAGVGFDLGSATTLRVGGGWAFDQDFRTGFDIRNDDGLLSPDDAVAVFLTVSGTF